MLLPIDAYFAAEKAESLVFLALGLGAITFAAFALWGWRDPLSKGMAIPLVLVGLIQVTVGTTIFFRTDPQAAALKAQVLAAPAQFKADETARMKTVRQSFRDYLVIEVAFIAAGLLLLLWPRLGRFWRGLGLGMLVQGALMLPADLLADQRAAVYVQRIEAMP